MKAPFNIEKYTLSQIEKSAEAISRLHAQLLRYEGSSGLFDTSKKSADGTLVMEGYDFDVLADMIFEGGSNVSHSGVEIFATILEYELQKSRLSHHNEFLTAYREGSKDAELLEVMQRSRSSEEKIQSDFSTKSSDHWLSRTRRK